MTKTGPDPLHPTTRIEPLVIVITFAVIEDVLAPSRRTCASSAASPSKTVPIGQLASALRRAMSSYPNSYGEFSSRLSGEERLKVHSKPVLA